MVTTSTVDPVRSGGVLDPGVWDGERMRAALHRRDISEVYRLLCDAGATQRRIAALTGQSQSEVSAIVAGRQVMAYDLLARIADGLGIPRGLLGLAHCEPVGVHAATRPSGPDEGVLGVALGLAVGGDAPPRPVPPVRTPPPSRVGAGEVAQVRAITAALAGLDRRHGSRAVRDAVLAQLTWAEDLVAGTARPDVARALQGALAELRSLAGWASHDVGLDGPAEGYLESALSAARAAGDPLRVVSVLHRLGCVHLDRGEPSTALRMFQLGQFAATEAETGPPAAAATALLHGHEAKAYADLGQVRQALSALHRAEDALPPDPAPAERRTPLLDSAGLDNLAGRVLAALADADPAHLDAAVAHLTGSARSEGAARGRRRALTLTRLAVTCLRHGAVADGVRHGEEAVAAAQGVRSARLARRTAALRAEALPVPPARDLVERIDALGAAVA